MHYTFILVQKLISAKQENYESDRKLYKAILLLLPFWLSMASLQLHKLSNFIKYSYQKITFQAN